MKKTLIAKIVKPRRNKRKAIEQKYSNFQKVLHGDNSVPLYSAIKQNVECLRDNTPHKEKGAPHPFVEIQ